MLRRASAIVFAITAIVSTLGVSPVSAATHPHFSVSTLLLPNGKVLTTAYPDLRGVRWKDVEVALLALGVPPHHPYGQSVVGNHSDILSQKYMSTFNGEVWFALNKRTPPAASQNTKATYEYWVAVERTGRSTGHNIDYCLEAVVVGNRARAQQEVRQLLSGWMVPVSADPVPVLISHAPGNIKLARAVQTYLENTGDPNVKKFTIMKVVAGGKKFGKEQWTVKFNVEHQPSKADAYNNGVNYRYVDYKSYNNGYIVTGLATG